MRMRVRRLYPVMVIAAVAVTGCGGEDSGSDSSEEAAVLAPVESFYSGLAEGDGAAACGALTVEAAAQLEGESTGLAEGTSCEDAIEQVGGALNDEARQAIESVEPTVKEINGASATVETETLNVESSGADAEVQREASEIKLTKDGDEWKISELPENPQA